MGIRVLVADDFPLVREGLVAALESHPDVSVVGQAVDGQDAVDQVNALRPDVVLIDLKMPVLSGLMALMRIRTEQPGIPVLVISAEEGGAGVVDAAAAGAAGYISKRSTREEVCDAVVRVARGESVIGPALAGHLLHAFARDGDANSNRASGEKCMSPTSLLAVRELSVLRLLADGMTDKQISASLYISPRTVQAYLARIRDKTGLRRRAQLARWAVEHSIA
jgi:DNA-binding NarL/FixJ family response regulator